jgi:acetoacetate decarboxylase
VSDNIKSSFVHEIGMETWYQLASIEMMPVEIPGGTMKSALSAAHFKKTIHPDLGGAFSMPILSPMIGAPPPYRYKDTRNINILFKTDPELLEKMTPPPLKPSPNRLMIFYIGLFKFADYDMHYHEAGLLIPVIHEGQNGNYPIVLYLDQANPIVGGREIYGWPKKEAEKISFKEEHGKISASVTRYGQQIIEASFESQQKVDPIPKRPKEPMFTLKYIPSALKDAPPDVLKLISCTNDPDVITELQIGKATLKFGASLFDDLLARIPIQGIIYAEAIMHDFTMGYGELVVDYLSSKQE